MDALTLLAVARSVGLTAERDGDQPDFESTGRLGVIDMFRDRRRLVALPKEPEETP